MTKEERYEILGKYLREELTGLERKALEEQLDTDTDLREELEFHRGLHQAVGDKRLDYFQELVKESEQQYFKKTAAKKGGYRQYLKVAAVIALLLTAALTYLVFTSKPTPEALFTSYFQPYQSPGTFRSEDLTSLDQDFILALARYDEQQYAEAAAYFTKTLEKDPDKDIAFFLRGVSRLALDQKEAAQSDLQRVIADEQSLFREQAQWYLALLYLKAGEVVKAREVLERMEQREEVRALLEAIH